MILPAPEEPVMPAVGMVVEIEEVVVEVQVDMQGHENHDVQEIDYNMRCEFLKAKTAVKMCVCMYVCNQSLL